MKTNLTPIGAPVSALKPETQRGIEAVKRVILKTHDPQDTEETCRLLASLIEKALFDPCALGFADRQDIGQVVLVELLRTLPSDAWLQKLVLRRAPDRRLLNGLRRQAYARVRSRTFDHIRRWAARREEPLEDIAQEDAAASLPSPTEVCAAIKNSPRFDKCYRKDLRYVMDMIARGMSARKTAAAHSVSPATVDRAIKRVRPVLRAEFGLDE